MKKFLITIGVLFAGFILLMAAASIAIKVYLPPEKIKALIEKETAARFHRQVELQSISVGIVQGLQISNFKLSESPDFGSGTFIESEKFVLHVRLIPLLFKKVLIKDIELVRPRVSVVRYADGKTYNFSSLIPASNSIPAATPPAPKESSGSSSSLTLLVSNASLQQGTVTFLDQSPSKQSLSIDDLNLALKNFSLTAPMNLQTSFTFKFKEIQSRINFAGEVGWDGSLKIKTCDMTNGPSKIALTGSAKNLLADTPTFDVALSVQNLQTSLLFAFAALPKNLTVKGPIDGSLTAQGSTDNLSLSTNFNLGTFNLKGEGSIQNAMNDARTFKLKFITNTFPIAELLQRVPVAKLPADLKLSGSLQCNADINGTAAAGQVSFKTDAKALDVSYGDSFKKTSGVPLRLDASGTYAGNMTLDFSALSMTLGAMTLSGAGRYVTDPKLDRYFFTLKSNSFPLEDLAASVPPLHPYDLSGKAELNAKIVSTAAMPDVSGTLALSNTAIRYQDSRLTQLAAPISFTTDAVVISKMTGLLNGSSLKIDLNAQKIKTHPVVVSDIQVAMLDLDKLIPSPAAPNTPQKTDARDLFVTEAFAEPIPAKSTMDLPMNLSGTFKAAQIKHQYLTGENLDIKWNLTDVTPDLAKMNGSATLRQGKGEFKNIQKLTSGSKAANILLLPVTLLQKLDKATHGALKLPPFDDIQYKEILGEYAFKMGVMNVSKFLINADSLNASMTGTVGLLGAQPLDLKSIVKTNISDPALSTINFSIKGTLMDPKPALDVAATGKNVLESLKKSGAADKFLQKFGLPALGGTQKTTEQPTSPPPTTGDSTNSAGAAPAPPPADSSQNDSKKEQLKQLEGVLKGLFNK